MSVSYHIYLNTAQNMIVKWHASEMRELHHSKRKKKDRQRTQPWGFGLSCVVNSCMLSSLRQWDVTEPPVPAAHLPGSLGGEIPSGGTDRIRCRPQNIPLRTISLICSPLPLPLSLSLTSPEFHWVYVSFCFVKRRQRDGFLVKTLFLQASFMKSLTSNLLTALMTPLICKELRVSLCVSVVVQVCVCVCMTKHKPPHFLAVAVELIRFWRRRLLWQVSLKYE